MKRTVFLFGLITILFLGCEKDDEESIIFESNSIAQDLQRIIENENVELILPCPLGNNCSGGTDEYSFPGDNFILLFDNKHYNLNHLIWTETGRDQVNRVVLTLYFDPYGF
jgi:hypothetical protein